MNKYIVPIADTYESNCYLKVINASSYQDCTDKLMQMFAEYSNSTDWNDFLSDLKGNEILIGEIKDIEEL